MSLGHPSEYGKEQRLDLFTALKKKGIKHVFVSAIKETSTLVNNSLKLLYYKMFRSSLNFNLNGNVYNYFYHSYNRTWRNERAVEIPIVSSIVEQSKGKRILEIGNVLSHYRTVNHDIVDKYERIPGVMNQDIVDFHPDKKYDLIIGISTLEHIGWDEEREDPEKPLRAIENLKTILAPNGKLVLTIPIGYNPHLDRHIDEGKLQTTEMYCLKRISANNRWREAKWAEIKGSKFHSPFHNANGLVIAVIENNGSSWIGHHSRLAIHRFC